MNDSPLKRAGDGAGWHSNRTVFYTSDAQHRQLAASTRGRAA